MNSEHFIKYLKNPKLLNEVTYQELSQLRDKYPYSHILHYLLFLKSQQTPADLAEHNKNAHIFAVDNTKLFEEIKLFQELEQKPTENHTMDDLFDLSEKDDDKEKIGSKNELTPSSDSLEPKKPTPTTNQDTKPRVIREQRYIPLDPKIYGTERKDTYVRPIKEESVTQPVSPKEELTEISRFIKNDIEDVPPIKDEPIKQPVSPKEETTEISRFIKGDTEYVSPINDEPIKQPVSPKEATTEIPLSINNDTEEIDTTDPEKSNVFFIDALINRDSTPNQSEVSQNKDAYSEVTDSPIVEPETTDEEVPIEPITQTTHISSFEETVRHIQGKVSSPEHIEIPLEVTNDDEQKVVPVIEDEIIIRDATVVNEVAGEVEAIEEKHDDTMGKRNPPKAKNKDDRETKKSFDKWVKKKDNEGAKKKAGKKKKKKKDKMPLNAKVSLQETDFIASETLAELLVKQGKNKKAIKVYERLCLIFPEKSNYFAQIITNLKEKS